MSRWSTNRETKIISGVEVLCFVCVQGFARQMGSCFGRISACPKSFGNVIASVGLLPETQVMMR
jgi:hypothetical protein